MDSEPDFSDRRTIGQLASERFQQSPERQKAVSEDIQNRLGEKDSDRLWSLSSESFAPQDRDELALMMMHVADLRGTVCGRKRYSGDAS